MPRRRRIPCRMNLFSSSMAACLAYTVFANKGIRVEPLFVTRIEDSYGNTIANFTPQMSEVLTEDASYKMLHMLKSVIDGGTGGRVRFR